MTETLFILSSTAAQSTIAPFSQGYYCIERVYINSIMIFLFMLLMLFDVWLLYSKIRGWIRVHKSRKLGK